jgi:large subunit ribosomal protein L18
MSKTNAKKARHMRVRKKISGTFDCPRLCVFRSLKYISVQIIDDIAGHTLVAASTFDKDFNKNKNSKNMNAAMWLGAKVAKIAQLKGIKKVVFDKNCYAYHGRIAALAEAARAEGLEF